MLTRRSIDLPSGPDPLITPATSIDGRFEQLEAAIAHERRERRRLLDALAAWVEWLNGDGALDISDAAIEGSPIGASAPDTGKFTTLEVTTSSTFPTGSSTPTPTSGTGTFTTVTGAVNYTQIGDRVAFNVAVVITTNGTAATDVRVTMPFTAAATTPIAGADNSLTFGLMGHVTGALLLIKKYDGTYPGADGRTLNVAGVVRV